MKVAARSLCALVLWGSAGCRAGETVGCAKPRPLHYANGEATGFVRCADGTTHRVEALPVPAPASAPDCRGEGYFLDCADDSECSEGPNGHCGQYDPGCSCSYHCRSDEDCDVGQACIADVVTGEFDYATCHTANCLSGADCLSGECALAEQGVECTRSYGLQCRSVADACRVDDDCVEDTGVCRIDGTEGSTSFACVDSELACPN